MKRKIFINDVLGNENYQIPATFLYNQSQNTNSSQNILYGKNRLPATGFGFVLPTDRSPNRTQTLTHMHTPCDKNTQTHTHTPNTIASERDNKQTLRRSECALNKYETCRRENILVIDKCARILLCMLSQHIPHTNWGVYKCQLFSRTLICSCVCVCVG